MSRFQVMLGELEVSVLLPDNVLAAMLPAYLKPLNSPVFPQRQIVLDLHPLAELEPGSLDISGQYGLGRAACVPPRVGDSLHDSHWHFFVHLPEGPERADRLPSKCVVPCLYIALRSLGILALHASAVIATHSGSSSGSRNAIVIAGATGRGKSTTAAALAALGASPLADDRVLLQARDDRWWVTASPECPNPFARRTGYPAEFGPIPHRVPDDRAIAAPLGRLIFPEVHPNEESRSDVLSSARATALLAAAGGPPPVEDPAGTVEHGMRVNEQRSGIQVSMPQGPPVPPAVRLTLGRDAATLFQRFWTS